MFTLTPARRALLGAIADTFVPAGNGADGLPPGSAVVDFEQVAAAIRAQPLGAQQEFGKLLDLLEKPLVGFTWLGPLKPFAQLTAAQREQLLLSWAASRLPPLRKGFQALRKLCTFLYYAGSPADGRLNPAPCCHPIVGCPWPRPGLCSR